MKDEFKGEIISEFVGLNSKKYSLVSVDGKENKKAKGINENVVKTQDIRNLLMLCFIKKYWDITWKEFKVSCIELEFMFVKFPCLLLMIKDTY